MKIQRLVPHNYEYTPNSVEPINKMKDWYQSHIASIEGYFEMCVQKIQRLWKTDTMLKYMKVNFFIVIHFKYVPNKKLSVLVPDIRQKANGHHKIKIKENIYAHP